MKQRFAWLLAVLLVLSVCIGCDNHADGTTQTPATPTTTTPATTQTTPTQATVPPTTQTQPPEPTVVYESYVVTLDPNGGTCETVTIEFMEYDCYGDLAVPVRSGYVFQGWFTEAEGGQQILPDMVMAVAGDHTLYAQWKVKTEFTITLDPNGGRISSDSSRLELKNGDKYGTMAEPVREGYKFLGWYTEPDGGTRVKSTTKFTGNDDQVLYAHWEYVPAEYWAYILKSRVEQIPQDRKVVVYLERNAGYKTYIDCPFLTDAGAINPAEGLEEYKVTDDWIRSTNPHIIVKLCTDMDMAMISKIGMQRRFPDMDIYIFSTNAVSGKDNYKLYCRLYLAKLLYPEYFEDVDLDTVKAELKVNATVYH